MYKIIAQRSSGKTCNIIREAIRNQKPACIVCKHPETIRERMIELGWDAIKSDIIAITYEQYLYDDTDAGRDIYIDEIDMFLKTYDPMLQGYTLSIDD